MSVSIDSLPSSFNAGCDARIAGLTLDANPHNMQTPQYRSWRAGWTDADKHWGEWARWPVPALPRIDGAGQTREFLERMYEHGKASTR